MATGSSHTMYSYHALNFVWGEQWYVLCVYRFWFFKWLLVIGLIIAFFFIPEGSNFIFSQGKIFNKLYDKVMYKNVCSVLHKRHYLCLLDMEFNFPFTVSVAFGLSASIIFIVVQIIILVDFAHSWAENW